MNLIVWKLIIKDDRLEAFVISVKYESYESVLESLRIKFRIYFPKNKNGIFSLKLVKKHHGLLLECPF